MPAPRVFDSRPPLSTAKLAALEEQIGAKLPLVYREFLLTHNGGRAEPEAFMKNGTPYSRLNLFFGVGGKDRIFDLRTQWRKTRDIMPAEVMPIALDLGGNKICLAIKGKNRGKVYFWDHEGAPEPSDIRAKYPEFFLDLEDEPEPPPQPDWPGYPELTLIADSFDEFLQSFHEEPELPPQPESPEDPDLVLVDIDPDQFLPSLDGDDELEKPGKSAEKRTAPKARKQPGRSSSKKRTARPRKKRTSRTTGPRKKR